MCGGIASEYRLKVLLGAQRKGVRSAGVETSFSRAGQKFPQRMKTAAKDDVGEDDGNMELKEWTDKNPKRNA